MKLQEEKVLSLTETGLMVGKEPKDIKIGDRFGWNEEQYEVINLIDNQSTIKRVAFSETDTMKYPHDSGGFNELKYFGPTVPSVVSPELDSGNKKNYRPTLTPNTDMSQTQREKTVMEKNKIFPRPEVKSPRSIDTPSHGEPFNPINNPQDLDKRYWRSTKNKQSMTEEETMRKVDKIDFNKLPKSLQKDVLGMMGSMYRMNAPYSKFYLWTGDQKIDRGMYGDLEDLFRSPYEGMYDYAINMDTKELYKVKEEIESSLNKKSNIEIYDNGGESIDRYTIFIGNAVYGMNNAPLSPSGFNQYIGTSEEIEHGPHLGKKVELKDLPEDVQKAIELRKTSSIKQSWLKVATEFTEENIKKELAEDLKVEVDDIEIKDQVSGYEIYDVKVNDEEYQIAMSEDEAESLALERVEEDLENEPSLFNQDWLMQFIEISDTDRRMISGEEADNLVDEVYDDDDILEKADKLEDYNATEDESEQEELLEEAKEIIRELEGDKIYDELSDPIQYFVEDKGIYTIEELLKAPFIRINITEAKNDAIATDGWQHFIASYDGESHETKSGFVYWRI